MFDSFIDIYNRAGDDLSASDLMAVGIAVLRLGFSNPDLFKDALLAFDDAAAADPGDERSESLLAVKGQSPPDIDTRFEVGAICEICVNYPLGI